MLDLVVTRQQLFMLGEDQCFQCRGIKLIEIGESAMSGNHRCESSRLLLQQNENVQENKNYVAHTAICGAELRTGRRQSIPSSNIDNCACVSDTVPLVACGQMNRPRSRRLAN